MIREWGIADEDIYNLDKTGFAMGMVATAKVITQADKRSRPSLVQLGNREWVTASMRLKPKNAEIPLDWTIGVSDNSWTND